MEEVEDYIDEPDDIFDGEAIENDAEETVEDSNNVANPAEPENPEKVAVPKKRIVRKPRLKFNPERLCGERGIPILVNHFKDVKFKGKGHEVEDLDKLLSKLEHWTHRLFPSMKFLDCLKHIEHLGRKRAVQVCVSKIRMDMPILNNDFITQDQEKDDVRRGSDSDTSEVALGNEFDQLMAQYQQTQTAGGNEFSDLDSDNDDVSPSNSQMSPVPNLNETASVSKELTDEQKQRIEQNRKLAAERLKARQAGLNVSSLDALNEMSRENQTTQNTSKLTNSQLNDSDILGEHSHESDDLDNSEDRSKSKTIMNDSDEDVDIDDLVENSFQPSRKQVFANDSDSDSNSQIRLKKTVQIESDDSSDYMKSTEKFKISSNEGTSRNAFHNNLESQAESSKSHRHQKKRRKIKIDSDESENDSDIELKSIKKIATDSNDRDNLMSHNIKPPTTNVFTNIDSDSDDYDSQIHRKKTKNTKIDSSDGDNLVNYNIKPPTTNVFANIDSDSDDYDFQIHRKKTKNTKIDSDDDNLIVSTNKTRNKSSFNNVDLDSDNSIDILEKGQQASVKQTINIDDSDSYDSDILEKKRHKASKKQIINIADTDSDDDPQVYVKKNRKIVIDSDDDDNNDLVIGDLKPPVNNTDLNSSDNDDSKTNFEGNINIGSTDENTAIKDDSDISKNNIPNAELSDNIFNASSTDLSVVTPLITNSQGSENFASVNSELDSELNNMKSRHKQVKRLRIDSDEDSESN